MANIPLPEPNPRPVEILAFIPSLKIANPNKTGWIVGWLYEGFFCTPGHAYGPEEITTWQHLPEAPEG